MTRRARSASFGSDLHPVLLQALLDARIWTLRYGQSHTDVRPICDAVTQSIDKLGEHLTGDPEIFWRKIATTYPGMQKESGEG